MNGVVVLSTRNGACLYARRWAPNFGLRGDFGDAADSTSSELAGDDIDGASSPAAMHLSGMIFALDLDAIVGPSVLFGGALQGAELSATYRTGLQRWDLAESFVDLPAGRVTLSGAGLALRNSLAHTLCQTYVADAYRGRVTSLLALQMTAAQAGTFLVGLAAAWLGPRWALAGMGLVLAAVSLGALALLAPLRRLD